LQCSTDEIVRRIGNADRVARKKMASEQSARAFMAQHRICAVPRSTCLRLDSEANDADTNTNSIVEYFKIDGPQGVFSGRLGRARTRCDTPTRSLLAARAAHIASAVRYTSLTVVVNSP
jgi:hypothetical protein